MDDAENHPAWASYRYRHHIARETWDAFRDGWDECAYYAEEDRRNMGAV